MAKMYRYTITIDGPDLVHLRIVDDKAKIFGSILKLELSYEQTKNLAAGLHEAVRRIDKYTKKTE